VGRVGRFSGAFLTNHPAEDIVHTPGKLWKRVAFLETPTGCLTHLFDNRRIVKEVLDRLAQL
jgi:hypothetical protein